MQQYNKNECNTLNNNTNYTEKQHAVFQQFQSFLYFSSSILFTFIQILAEIYRNRFK